jgi:uncharacterized protein YeaO (DUF488 family)
MTRPVLKRVYETPGADDGMRILVDRLWPRGLSKDKAKVDLWLKDVSPSDELRRNLHGDPARWDEFVAAYDRELRQEPAKSALVVLRAHIAKGRVTLLYAARDEAHNNAVALLGWLEKHQ